MKTIEENNILIASPKWERINFDTYRLPVYGGWLVNSLNNLGEDLISVFVPDVMHAWVIKYPEKTNEH